VGFGEAWCFTIDAMSYVAVIVSLVAMRVRPRPSRKARRLRDELREGLRYVVAHERIRSLLALLALVSLFGMPYSTLLPVFARDVFHGNAHTLGILNGASGGGAMLGALWLAARGKTQKLPPLVIITGCIFGVGLVAFGLSRWLPVSLALMVVAGLGMMVQMSATNTLLQTLVDEDKRGRVMSFYTMAFFGMTPVGALAAGVLAQRTSAQTALIVSGIATTLIVAAFRRRILGTVLA
jgi:predicted MFS family arabinose efflux permease